MPHLQREVGEVVRYDGTAGGCMTVLEYQLPLEVPYRHGLSFGTYMLGACH